MTYDEFYKMRIGEVIDLIEIKNKAEIENINLQSQFYGNICATIANFSLSKKTKKYKSTDFFKPIKQKPKKQSAEEIAQIFTALTIALEGEVKL